MGGLAVLTVNASRSAQEQVSLMTDNGLGGGVRIRSAMVDNALGRSLFGYITAAHHSPVVIEFGQCAGQNMRYSFFK